MKNKLIMILFLMIVLIGLTGCGDSNVKILNCTATGTSVMGESTSDLRVKIKNKEVKDMTLTLNMELSKEQQSNRQAIMNQLRQKTNRVYVTEKGVKAIFNMGNSYFNMLGINKNVSYNELKQVLELQGYTCKE